MIADVAARLELLLPGLRSLAGERAARGHARMAELWARRHPDRPLRPFDGPSDAHMLGPDTLLAHAEALGWHIDSRALASLDDDDFIPAILGDLPTLAEPIFVVDHRNGCHLVPASDLPEFVADEPEIHRHGDAIFVCTVSARIVVAHHEDWLFNLTSPRGT